MNWIECKPGTDWHDLQVRVSQILGESGLASQVGTKISTARGQVEIDVYATDPKTTPPAIYLCECKRWATRVPQAEVQAFRTIVTDVGAHFGLFISAAGFQAGAFEVVKHTNIHLLDWGSFQHVFIERWCKQFWIPTFRSRADSLAGSVEPLRSDAFRREANGEPLEAEEAVGLMALDMWGKPLNGILGTMFGLPEDPVANEIWVLRDKFKQYLPKEVAEAQDLRALLDSLVTFSDQWIEDRNNARNG